MTATATDPLALEHQVCFALVATTRAVLAAYRPVLEPLGLTHPQYLVMLSLWERSPQNARTVADALWLEPSTVTPLLKRLEGLGLITRSRNPADERELRIGLTPAGAALRARALDVPGAVVERLGLPAAALEDVRDHLAALLGRIATVTGDDALAAPGTLARPR